jgi:hypothetical protein
MTNYLQIRHQLESLTSDEQLRLLEDIAAIIRRRNISSPRHSIMELEGLGQEIWQGVDAQEYVDRERDSWND